MSKIREHTKKHYRTNGGNQGKSHTDLDGDFKLDKEQLLKIHDHMVLSRIIEERMIRMLKQSDGYFWIGGPGEEAFQIPLGSQIYKGEGLNHDFMHLHYRSCGVLVAMGMNPVDPLRQMKNTATDPFSGGRNFSNHYSVKKWNVIPVTSTIETQFATAIGTGIAHKQHGGKGITIVNGGDAGSAEADFASCMIWASRPKQELPILMIVMHNRWGISTPSESQHGEEYISDRAKPFGIEVDRINGNDVEDSWYAIEKGMKYVREKRKPYMIEAKVSRLYGHSSASGANRIEGEEDPLEIFEKRLDKAGYLSAKGSKEIQEHYYNQVLALAKKVKDDPQPDPASIYDFTYFGQRGKYF